MTSLVTLGVSLASAQTVNVAFHGAESYSGVSGLPGSTASDYWNVVPFSDFYLQQSASNLFDVDGVNSGLGFSEVTGGESSGSFFLGGIVGNGVGLFDGYAHAGGAALNFTLNGLRAGGSYDLYVYMGRNTGDEVDVQTGAVTLMTNGLVTLNTIYYGPQDNFVEGTNYVVFSSVQADGSGEIAFSVSGGGIMNGFTVSAVPEPSAYAAIAGAMMLGMAMRRRRSGV